MTYLDLVGGLRELNLLSILLRFLLAALCGGVIGLERGRSQHAAGLRTHVLVCIGAALVMMTSQYISLYFQTGDPARLGAQVISGIGFLGVGSIIVTGRSHVRGLTTAAGLWASACMGLAAGIGFYEAAILTCVLLYGVLVGLNRLDARYVKSGAQIPVYIEYDSDIRFSTILQALRGLGCHVAEMKEVGRQNDRVVSMLVTLELRKDRDWAGVTGQVREIPGVLFVEEL